MIVEAGHKRDRMSAAPRSLSSFRWLLLIAVAVVLASAAIAALGNVLSVGFLDEKNYNEGWNVYNTERLLNHETIYDDDLWRVNNYPIVSFVVVAGVNYAVHDLLVSGRLVALLSFIAIGVLAAMATGRLGGSRSDAVFAGGCALGFYYVTGPNWIAVDDPQALAEAFMVAGLAAYVGRPPTRGTLLGAAVLIMLGGFTKHNLLAIPVAITVDLAVRWPRRLPFWLASCAGIAILLLALTQLIAGGTFLEHLLSTRAYIWYNVHYHLMKFVRTFKVPLILVVLFSWRLFSRERLVLACYGVVAVLSGALLAGYDGTSYNMLQDASVFLAIACGLTLHELRGWAPIRWPSLRTPARIAISLAPLALAAPIMTTAAKALGNVSHPNRLLAADRVAEQSFRADAAYLSQRQGAKICESLLLCHESGAPFALDPFNSRQYILAGKLDQGELIRRVAAQEFAVIQLRADICDDPASSGCHILHYPRKFNRFTDEFLYAVDRSYRIDRRSQLGVFYIPK
ncbi:MAG TPA: hypothetical protein VET85_17505 [Stellaceae bacterium]|nr:hypothetical protein [Stellaceae bacterium]